MARFGLVLALPAAAAAWACNGTTTIPSSLLAAVRAIVVVPDAFTIAPKETRQLTATVTADAGADRTVTWSSSDTKVATVDQVTGVVTGAAAGAAVITATSRTTPAVTGKSNVTVSGGVDLTALYATFNISASKTTDTGCNFNQTFTGQLQVGGNTDGSAATFKMIEQITRAYAGKVSADGSFTGTGNLNGFIYDGAIAGQIGNGGASVLGSETLNFSTGCPGKTVIYQFTGSR